VSRHRGRGRPPTSTRQGSRRDRLNACVSRQRRPTQARRRLVKTTEGEGFPTPASQDRGGRDRLNIDVSRQRRVAYPTRTSQVGHPALEARSYLLFASRVFVAMPHTPGPAYAPLFTRYRLLTYGREHELMLPVLAVFLFRSHFSLFHVGRLQNNKYFYGIISEIKCLRLDRC
jgi:hypothetical protein